MLASSIPPHTVEYIYDTLEQRAPGDIRQIIRAKIEFAKHLHVHWPPFQGRQGVLVRDAAERIREPLDVLIANLRPETANVVLENLRRARQYVEGLRHLRIKRGSPRNAEYRCAALAACEIIDACSCDPLESKDGGNVHDIARQILADVFDVSVGPTGLLGACQEIRKVYLRGKPSLCDRRAV